MTKKNDILIEALRPYADGRSEQELEEGANTLMEFVKLVDQIHRRRKAEGINMPYEDGMSVRAEQNQSTKKWKPIVVFRGKELPIHREYESQEQAKLSGEDLCRKNGWIG